MYFENPAEVLICDIFSPSVSLLNSSNRRTSYFAFIDT